MKFSAKINIMPQDAILDPQGKTVEKNIPKLGIEHISNVRIGKHIYLELDGTDIKTAKKNIEEICEKLLVNQITEQYNYKIEKH